jgi:hypothetical protein
MPTHVRDSITSSTTSYSKRSVRHHPMLRRVGLVSVYSSIERRRNLRAVCFGHLHPDLDDIIFSRLQGQGGAININYEFRIQARLYLFSHTNKHVCAGTSKALRCRFRPPAISPYVLFCILETCSLYERPGVHALQPARALLRAVSVMSTTCNFSMSRGDHWTNRRRTRELLERTRVRRV